MTVIAMDVVNSETNVEIVRMAVISALQVSSRASLRARRGKLD